MQKQIQSAFIAGAFLAAGLFVTTSPVEAAIITASNEAAYATGTYRFSNGSTQPTTIINDQNGFDQLDVGNNTAGNWTAITWANNPQDLSRIILGFTAAVPTYMIANFVVQKAIVANPNGSVDSDWSTMQTYSGYPLTQNSFAFSPGVTSTGIRVLTTDTSTPDGKMRINEIWAFSNYNNLALTATVSAPGWATGNAFLNDENPSSQAYTFGQIGTNVFTWATPQAIGGLLLEGGNGSYPGSFSVQSWDGASWSTITNITGNTQLTESIPFQGRVMTTQLRLLYTANGGSTDALRVGEVFIFEAVPEPSTIMLFGLGGLVVVWKRRQAAK